METIAFIAAAALLGAFVWAQLTAVEARRRLDALRRNCFVTNSLGHRVRYAKASAEEQARAER